MFYRKKGFSNLEIYGNNNADGPFVYTGFKPALIILKNYGNLVDNGNKR